MKVAAYVDGYTTEDPSVVFSGDAIELASITFANNDAAPFCETAALDPDLMGGLITIVVNPKQATSATTFTLTLSVDLVLKA